MVIEYEDNSRLFRRDEFLVSFLVDARGGILTAKRFPNLRIIVPRDAALSPSRIIFRFLRPDSFMARPILNDCNGFASRLIQIQSSCNRFLKPILLELPHIASLRDGERELVVMRRNQDSGSWKEHNFVMDEAMLKENFGTHFDSLDSEEELKKKRVYRIATHEIPQYFSLISVFKRNRSPIGPDGGIIRDQSDERIRVKFPTGALIKKMNINLEIQNVSRDHIDQVVSIQNKLPTTPSGHNRYADVKQMIAWSPIVTVEPKRRKFRDNITIQIPVPLPSNYEGDLKDELGNVRLLYSISEHDTIWEDVTDNTQFTITDDILVHHTKISARIWLMYAPGYQVSELANRLYSLHCPTPYFGRFQLYTKPSKTTPNESKEECTVRCLLTTDDSSEKTLECKEGYQLVTTGPLVEVLSGSLYQVQTAGNLVTVTKSDDEPPAVLMEPFNENRINVPLRIRNFDDAFSGKIAFIQSKLSPTEGNNAESTLKRVNNKPVCTLDLHMSGEPDKKSHHDQPTTDQDIMRSHLDLRLVANLVGSDWPKLQAHLLPEATEQERKVACQEIMDQSNTDEERCFQLVNYWANYVDATGNQGNILSRALKAIGRDDVVKACMAGEHAELLVDDREIKEANDILNESDKIMKDDYANASNRNSDGSKRHNDSSDNSVNLPRDLDRHRDGSVAGGIAESVDESMIVEFGDDQSEMTRRELVTRDEEEGDEEEDETSSLVEKQVHDETDEVLEPTLEEIITMNKSKKENSLSDQEKIDAFLKLTAQIERDLPEPQLITPTPQHDTDVEVTETMETMPMAYSAVPDLMNYSMEEEEEEIIQEKKAKDLMYPYLLQLRSGVPDTIEHPKDEGDFRDEKTKNVKHPTKLQLQSAVPDRLEHPNEEEENVIHNQHQVMFMSAAPQSLQFEEEEDDDERVDKPELLLNILPDPPTDEPMMEKKEVKSLNQEPDLEKEEVQKQQPIYHEIYEPEPNVEKEIEEYEEVLQDGRILTKRFERTRTTRQILERTTRELLPEEVTHLNEEMDRENVDANEPVMIEVYEEELEDGTRINRRVATQFKSDTKTLKEVVLDEAPHEEIVVLDEAPHEEIVLDEVQHEELVLDQAANPQETDLLEVEVLEHEQGIGVTEEKSGPVTPTTATPLAENPPNEIGEEDIDPPNDESYQEETTTSMLSLAALSSSEDENDGDCDTEAKDTSSYYSL